MEASNAQGKPQGSDDKQITKTIINGSEYLRFKLIKIDLDNHVPMQGSDSIAYMDVIVKGNIEECQVDTISVCIRTSSKTYFRNQNVSIHNREEMNAGFREGESGGFPEDPDLSFVVAQGLEASSRFRCKKPVGMSAAAFFDKQQNFFFFNDASTGATTFTHDPRPKNTSNGGRVQYNVADTCFND